MLNDNISLSVYEEFVIKIAAFCNQEAFHSQLEQSILIMCVILIRSGYYGIEIKIGVFNFWLNFLSNSQT